MGPNRNSAYTRFLQYIKNEFQELLTGYPSYEEFYERLNTISFFSDMFQYDQGNPYHSLPLCQHTYMVYAHLTENYVGEDLFYYKLLQHFMIQGNRSAVYLKS